MEQIYLDAVLDGKAWLGAFRRKTYPEAYERYCARYAAAFAAAAEDASFPAAFAEALTAKLKKVFFWNRAAAWSDAKMMLVSYLLPMAAQREALAAAWNRKNPKDPVKPADYETILAGFRSTVLGFDLSKREKS